MKPFLLQNRVNWGDRNAKRSIRPVSLRGLLVPLARLPPISPFAIFLVLDIFVRARIKIVCERYVRDIESLAYLVNLNIQDQ